MAEAAYVSRVRIERVRGPLRLAWLPARDEPIEFGVHDEVADREAVQRAFDHHMPRCPVYRSISAAIDITTALETVS